MKFTLKENGYRLETQNEADKAWMRRVLGTAPMDMLVRKMACEELRARREYGEVQFDYGPERRDSDEWFMQWEYLIHRPAVQFPISLCSTCGSAVTDNVTLDGSRSNCPNGHDDYVCTFYRLEDLTGHAFPCADPTSEDLHPRVSSEEFGKILKESRW